MAPAKRLVPDMQKLEEHPVILLRPFPANGKNRSGIVGQYLTVICEAFVTGGFSFLIPRRIENAGKSLTPRHRIQTRSGRTQRDELIISLIEIQAMRQDN